MAEEIEIPHYFLCPISLEIMKDPVTLTSGITYDRDGIERWLFSGNGNAVCPITKQVLTDLSLTPNVTLRRMIQSWCVVNSNHGVQRLPTPKAPVSRSQISRMMGEAKKSSSREMHTRCLMKFKAIANENESNKRTMEAAGVVEFIASLIANKTLESEARDEALSLLYSLQLSEASLGFLSTTDFIASLSDSVRNGSFESRAHSITLLNQILEATDPDPSLFIALQPEFFVQSARILKDQISQKASKSALKVLITSTPWGRNRIKAAESGAVPILIQLLLDKPEKRACELILTLLDLLCQCAEGRAELLRHAAGLAVVSKTILRVSPVASDRAVKILHSVSRFSATPGILQEMLQMGVVTKLCLAAQVDSGLRTQERSWEILKMHSKTWKNSPCFHHHKNLVSMFPK